MIEGRGTNISRVPQATFFPDLIQFWYHFDTKNSLDPILILDINLFLFRNVLCIKSLISILDQICSHFDIRIASYLTSKHEQIFWSIDGSILISYWYRNEIKTGSKNLIWFWSNFLYPIEIKLIATQIQLFDIKISSNLIQFW